MINIYVGNLSFNTTEAELREAFSVYGEVLKASIVKDRETNRPRGFAFVEMANQNEGQNAIAGLNGKDLGGRSISCNEARERPARSGGGGGGGGGRGGYGGGGGGGGYNRDRGDRGDRGSRY